MRYQGWNQNKINIDVINEQKEFNIILMNSKFIDCIIALEQNIYVGFNTFNRVFVGSVLHSTTWRLQAQCW